MIDQELDVVGTAFADLRLDTDAHDVISRGRALRRRRKAVPAVATAAILAASLSLAAVTQSSPAGHTLAYRGAVVNVDEAGFSIHTDAKTGDVTVTVSQLFDEASLRELLAEAGVPAAFHKATLPAGTPATYPPVSCTWTGVRVLDSGDVLGGLRGDGDKLVFTIHASKMPPGSVLGISYGTFRAGTNPPLSSMKVVSIVPSVLSGEPTGCVMPAPAPSLR